MRLRSHPIITFVHRLRFDLNLNHQRGSRFSQQLRTALSEQFPDDESGRFMDVRLIFESHSEVRQEVLAQYGGLMFVGIFVGSLFLLATGLIIFYKQISEGLEDQERFEIMQKVGMSQKEVKRTINTQVFSMFFLPLFMAILHNIFAFNITKNILELMELDNVRLFVFCTIITIGIFTVVYGILYLGTTKIYFRIVDNQIK